MNIPGSSRLELLPSELLCNIADCLRPGSLVALAGVSRTLHPIAENTLHRSVTIHSSKDRWFDEFPCPFRLAKFLHTMLRRPDLQKLVKSATLIVSSLAVPVALGHPDGLLIPTTPVASALTGTLSETELTGHLLMLLPELRVLELDTYHALGEGTQTPSANSHGKTQGRQS